jgi:hypothetical protein
MSKDTIKLDLGDGRILSITQEKADGTTSAFPSWGKREDGTVEVLIMDSDGKPNIVGADVMDGRTLGEFLTRTYDSL